MKPENPMDQDLPTLKRQLAQLKELHEAGVLPAAQYEEGKAALERRTLDLVLSGAVDAPPTSATQGAPGRDPAKPSRRLLGTLAAVVLLIAAAGYWWMGSPAQIGLGPATVGGAASQEAGADGGQPHPTSAEQIAAMVERLAARLQEKPDDAEGWAMLARSYTVLGRHPEALKAYERAIALHRDDAQLLADYADALAVKNNRNLAGEPMKWVESALKLDPRNLKALALAGTHAFDRKDYAAAVKYWEQVMEFGPADGSYVQQVESSLAQARELGGLPKTGKPATPSAGLPQKAVSGTVSVAPALAKQVDPGDTVFIFARSAEGAQRMPLAILRKQGKDLPIQFTLDDSLAMSPAAKISDARTVIITARVSKSGDALPQSGDLLGQSGPVKVGSAALKLEIREQVKQ